MVVIRLDKKPANPPPVIKFIIPIKIPKGIPKEKEVEIDPCIIPTRPPAAAPPTDPTVPLTLRYTSLSSIVRNFLLIMYINFLRINILNKLVKLNC